MKLVKGAAVLIIALGVAAMLVWQFWLKDQIELARVATPYGAKMVCSCRFVAERDMDSCKQDFTENLSAVSLTETPNRIQASVLGGMVHAEARYEPGLGCTLANSR